MKIETKNSIVLNEPNQIGDYFIIKQSTPEIDELLEALNGFRYKDNRVDFKIICKKSIWAHEQIRSIGWKLTFPEVPQVEKEVELLRKWYAKL